MSLRTAVSGLMVVLGLAAIVSVFLWSAFNVQWWVPFGASFSGREFALTMLHVVLIAFTAPSAAMYSDYRRADRNGT